MKFYRLDALRFFDGQTPMTDYGSRPYNIEAGDRIVIIFHEGTDEYRFIKADDGQALRQSVIAGAIVAGFGHLIVANNDGNDSIYTDLNVVVWRDYRPHDKENKLSGDPTVIG